MIPNILMFVQSESRERASPTGGGRTRGASTAHKSWQAARGGLGTDFLATDRFAGNFDCPV